MRGITRKIAPALLLGFLTFAVGQPKAQGQETEQVVKKCSDAVVLIFVSDSGKETSLGSGFVITPDGKIVTNYHVIKDATKALVKLTNGAFFPVESVLASDSAEDLAIVKVAGRNLPTLKMANSDTVQVGERVVAIGSPLGLESTVSRDCECSSKRTNCGVDSNNRSRVSGKQRRTFASVGRQCCRCHHMGPEIGPESQFCSIVE